MDFSYVGRHWKTRGMAGAMHGEDLATICNTWYIFPAHPLNVDPGLINPCLLIWVFPNFVGDLSLLEGNTPILTNRGLLIRGQHYVVPHLKLSSLKFLKWSPTRGFWVVPVVTCFTDKWNATSRRRGSSGKKVLQGTEPEVACHLRLQRWGMWSATCRGKSIHME